MISAIVGLVLGLLIFVSYFDIKYKAVPSVFLTATIFACLLLRPENLIFGVIAFVFGLLIKDMISDVGGMEFGIADIKILTIFGLLASGIYGLFLIIILFLIFQFVYTVIWRYWISKEEEMPFIPCLLAIYVTLMIVGGVA